MQRFCDGCRRPHDLAAFDLDSNEANVLCRAYMRRQARAARLSARRKAQSKIESLEQQRRRLIAALVKIDQEIAREEAAREKALQTVFPPLIPGEGDDVFGDEGDRESGD